jgi:hypothetical protein
MSTPIEICLQLLVAVQSKLQAEMPDLATWPVVKVNGETETQIDMMIGKGGPPAFGEISIRCSIPEESFSRRLMEAQVSSTTWDERDISITETQEIASLLREEYERRGGDAPVIIVSTLHRLGEQTKEIVATREVKVRSPPKGLEIDLNKEERIDEHSLANALFEDLLSLRRIHERLTTRNSFTHEAPKTGSR